MITRGFCSVVRTLFRRQNEFSCTPSYIDNLCHVVKPSLNMKINLVFLTSVLPIFTIMSKMALDCGAINLSQGFPDFSIDKKIIELVNQFMEADHNQYAPMPGTPELRRAISEVILRSFGIRRDPENEITITSGATEAIYAVITAFIAPGDEVIVFDPSYDSYNPVIRLNGGIPVHINLQYPDFSVDWDLVRSKISDRLKDCLNTRKSSGAVCWELI